MTAGIVAGVAAAAMLTPPVGLANKGGKPNSTRPCPVHTNHGTHKGQMKNASNGKRKGASTGKKCGK